ncbi:predicted protein [Histoplasma capsulatum var. duboisii H88]|uniref:Predicted protein n=1 Tax=Ajellomyces capsulatus (strain H88) TaxID=544711 RepID=F0UBG9_AJEC8|nr:predicted protein [Histoplasma capsulatum var. duboisii H88]
MSSLRSSTTSSCPQPSPVKKLSARAESISFVSVTTTLTVTAEASPHVPISSNLPSSSTHASFTSTSPLSAPSSSPLTGTAKTTTAAATAITSRPPDATGSAVVVSKCPSLKGVQTPIFVLLIILTIAAVMLSLAVCRVKKRQNFCKQCKEVVRSQTLTKQTPTSHDYGAQFPPGPETQTGTTERKRGMATSAMGLNSHACDAPHGIPQRTSVGQKNLRKLDLRINPMALRAPQLNCERPEPDTTSLYTSCLVSDGELQRRHASISIASIIDKYAQIPDDNRYHNFFQVAENNRIPENSQNRACDGSSLGGFRSGSLWYRMRDNDPAATKGPIVPGPSWKYPQRNGPGDVADCSYGPLIDPYVEAREKQELYLGVEKIRSSGFASSSRPSLDVKYQEPWTQKSEHAREGQQTESSYSPTDSSHTSQPSLMTSSTSPWPAKTRNVDDLSPNTVSRPVRDNNVPSDTTQGSNDNLSRMLKRWALLDQQNIGLVDRVPFRSYSARERLHDHLNGKFKPYTLNVRRPISIPLPGTLSRLSPSGASGAETTDDALLLMPNQPQNNLAQDDQTSGSAHTEDCTTNGGYVESPDAKVDGPHSRDVFGRPCLQQRTYSESIYSRPTTLQPVPVDWRSGNEKYTGQGYSSSLRRYHQRSYGSSKAGPSQPTPPMPFINAAVNESCEDNTYNKLDSRPQIVQRKKSYSCQFYLSEPGTNRDNALGRHSRKMNALDDIDSNYDVGTPIDPGRTSFLRGFVDIYGGIRRRRRRKKKGKMPIVGECRESKTSFRDVKKFFQN